MTKKRQTTMDGKKRSPIRTSLWLLAALLTAALTACAQTTADIPTAGESLAPVDATPAPMPVDEEDAYLVYARCVRENGFPEFPDPIPGQGIMLRRDQGMSFNDPRMQAAMEACQDLRPPGDYGAGPAGMGPGFGDEEAMLAFAQCMRDNGVPDFPDPPSQGGRMVIGADSGINPLDPRFQRALRTCFAATSEEDQ